MMHLCVFSNSHGAALKSALEEARAGAELKVTIFAAPNRGLEGLKPREDNRALCGRNAAIADMLAKTSGGLREAVLEDYDTFLVHGLMTVIPRIDQRHSVAIREAAIASMLSQELGISIARMLARMTEKPVALSPEPLLSDMGWRLQPHWPKPPAKALPYETICEMVRAATDLGSVRFVPQPAETMGDHLDTKHEYSTGSRRVLNGEAHSEGDRRHMNGVYGGLVLRDAVTVLAT